MFVRCQSSELTNPLHKRMQHDLSNRFVKQNAFRIRCKFPDTPLQLSLQALLCEWRRREFRQRSMKLTVPKKGLGSPLATASRAILCHISLRAGSGGVNNDRRTKILPIVEKVTAIFP